MKKNNLYIVGGVVIVLLLIWVGYSYWQNSAEALAKEAIGHYWAAEFEEALQDADSAKRKGYSDTSFEITYAQILAKLERYDEARAHYELIKIEDPSSIQAIDELIARWP